MNQAHVSIGSNIEPEVHVPAAVTALRAAFGAVQVSPFFRTSAIGRPEQPDYWNGVAAFATESARPVIVDSLHQIEASAGRVRTDDTYAARTLDLDLIGWNGEMDPEVAERDFLQAGLSALLGLPTDLPVVWEAQP